MSKAEQLRAPFHPDDIEWRVQQAGVSGQGRPWAMVLAYVTNRAIQQRLDDVFGCTGWQNKFHDAGKAIECGIGVRATYGDSGAEWIWKWDAAEETDIEAVKGGRSNAMKRAAVQWGIGRYLYNLDATFAECQYERPTEKVGWNKQYDKKAGKAFYWKVPQLPGWALPKGKVEAVK